MKRIGTAALSAISAVALSTTFLAAPAWAGNGHGNGNGQTNGQSAEHGNPHANGSGMTEDNDTNDGGTPNNVVDDGDNAHPSGRDRSVEHGNSGNQGNAQSDPDDDGRGPDRSNGGADKPNGPGGVDRADQDGNNGCGNDDDFEDDNEGWCGHKPKPEHQQPGHAKPEQPKPEQPKPEQPKPEHPKPGHEATPGAPAGSETPAPSHDGGHHGSADSCERNGHDHTGGGTEHEPAAQPEDDDVTAAPSHDRSDRDDRDDRDHELHDIIIRSNANADEDAAAVTTTTTTIDECDDQASMPVGSVNDDCGEVLALEMTSGGSTVNGAGATATPVVLTADLATATTPAPSVLGAETSRGALASVAAGSLAFTGDHIMILVIAGLVTMLLGWVLVRQARRGGTTTA